jgi:hypothetical protein
MNHRDFRLAGKIFASLGVPIERWGMVNLTLEQQRTILKNSSIGFQYALAGMEFAHSNLLLVLDPKTPHRKMDLRNRLIRAAISISH